MSTRKLIVAALICALAILVAGVVQLVRISDGRGGTAQVLAEGEGATVGGVSVAISGSTITDRALEVEVRFAPAATDAEVPVTSFTLLVGGKLEQPTNGGSSPAPACPPTIVVGSAGATCVVSFSPREGTATVAFSRGGEQRVWRLAPTVT